MSDRLLQSTQDEKKIFQTKSEYKQKLRLGKLGRDSGKASKLIYSEKVGYRIRKADWEHQIGIMEPRIKESKSGGVTCRKWRKEHYNYLKGKTKMGEV